MMTIVEVKTNEAFADSALVARKFGMKHNKLVAVIENTLDDYPDLRGSSNAPKTSEKHFIEARIYRGQPYMMNPDKLALLPLDDLLGVATFLKRKYAERKG